MATQVDSPDDVVEVHPTTTTPPPATSGSLGDFFGNAYKVVNGFFKRDPKAVSDAAIKIMKNPPEAINQAYGMGSGIYNIVGNLGGMTKGIVTGNPQQMLSSGVQLGQTAKEIVATPARELMGRTQPGYPPESAPTNPLQAVEGALISAAGGDAAKMRMLNNQGDSSGAIQAAWTVPLLSYGLGRLLPEVGRTAAPPSLKLARKTFNENFASNVASGMGPVEATVDAAGKKLGSKMLPPVEDQAKTITKATGEGSKSVRKAYEQVLPDVNETARISGFVPASGEEAAQLMDQTMGRTEQNYQNLLNKVSIDQNGNTRFVSGIPVADAIRKEIKPHMQGTGATLDIFEDASGNLTANPVGTNGIPNKPVLAGSEKLGRTLEAYAQQWEKNFDLKSLDEHRKYLFGIDKDTAATRIETRTKMEKVADTAAERAIQNIVYNETQAAATSSGLPSNYVRNLKKTQANLYDILDTLRDQNIKLDNKEAIRQGTPITQRINISSGVDPKGQVVTRAHGLANLVFGDPKSLNSANKAVSKTFPVSNPAPGAIRKAASTYIVPAAKQAIIAGSARTPPPVAVQDQVTTTHKIGDNITLHDGTSGIIAGFTPDGGIILK